MSPACPEFQKGAAWIRKLVDAYYTPEFSFGHFIQGKPWPQLLEAYTFKDGNIWPIVLLVTVMAPYIAAKMRGLI